MTTFASVFDPTVSDKQSKVRGVGRYLQTLKENFPDWNFTNKLEIRNLKLEIFINPFFNFLQTPLTLKRLARKQIAVVHDLIPLKYSEHFPAGIKGKLNIFLNKFALKNYDVIVTDSEVSKKDIVSILKVDESKVKVIYPCLPKIFLDSKTEIPNQKSETNYNFLNSNIKSISNFDSRTSNFCVYVGDATWNKNLVNLARAIKEINVTCVFVGNIFKTSGINLDNVWQKELNEFLQMTKNDKRFIFSGFVPDEELVQLYQKAKCNILVSRDEGFGFSYLEAASMGCPSVLSDIPVLKEISASKGALFTNPQNPGEIANAIGELYFHIDKRNTLGFEAKNRSIYFNTNNFKKEFLEILKLDFHD